MLTGVVSVLAAEWVVGVPWQVLAVQTMVYVLARTSLSDESDAPEENLCP